MGESVVNFAKEKKPKPKYYIMFVWNYMTFWKKKYYTIREQISSCLGLEVREGLTTNKFWGVIYQLYLSALPKYQSMVLCWWIYKLMHLQKPQNLYHKKWIFISFKNLTINQNINERQNWMQTVTNKSHSITNKWHNYIERVGKKSSMFPLYCSDRLWCENPQSKWKFILFQDGKAYICEAQSASFSFFP